MDNCSSVPLGTWVNCIEHSLELSYLGTREPGVCIHHLLSLLSRVGPGGISLPPVLFALGKVAGEAPSCSQRRPLAES